MQQVKVSELNIKFFSEVAIQELFNSFVTPDSISSQIENCLLVANFLELQDLAKSLTYLLKLKSKTQVLSTSYQCDIDGNILSLCSLLRQSLLDEAKKHFGTALMEQLIPMLNKRISSYKRSPLNTNIDQGSTSTAILSSNTQLPSQFALHSNGAYGVTSVHAK